MIFQLRGALVALAIAAALAGAVAPSGASAGPAASVTCAAADGFDYGDVTYTFAPNPPGGYWLETAPPVLFPAGTTWLIEFSGTGTVTSFRLFEHATFDVIRDFDAVPVPGTVRYTFADETPVQYRLVVADEPVTATFACLDPSEAAALADAVPGCEVLATLPSDAVVGAFVTDAPIYWKPGAATSPLVTITAGNSTWVLGVDPTGDYYQIVWSCDLLWVPVETMGPNYDEVWQGAPLPTDVVE